MKKLILMLVAGVALISGFATNPAETLPFLIVANVSPVIALQNYGGIYEKKLFSTLVNGMEVFNDIEVHRLLKSKMNMTKLTVGDGARPYSGIEHAEPDALKYTGQVLETELGQRDFAIEIKKYKDSHLEEFYKKSEGYSATQKTIPFAEYTYNEVFNKLKSELNDKTAYRGFDKADAVAYDAEDTYAAGDYILITEDNLPNYYLCLATTTAGQSPSSTPAKWQKVNAEAICPGIGYRLDEGVTAGSITPVVTGALDEDSAYAGHTEIFRSHAVAYQKGGVVHYCSWNEFFKLLDNLEEKVAKYTEKDANWVNGRGIYLPKTNHKCLVLPCTWMSDTSRIVSTPRQNLLGATNLESDLNTVKVRDASNYVAMMSITFGLGFNYRDPEAIRINDQD